MKKNVFLIFVISCSFLLTKNVNAQTSGEILNLLIQKGVISKSEADSLQHQAMNDTVKDNNRQNKIPLFSSKPLQLGGFAHLRYQSNQQAAAPDGFDVHRARLDLKGPILPKFDYRLMVEFAGSPKITDVYITCKPYEFLKFQVGQFKIPFSSESNYADEKLELINRSQVVEALVARSNDIIGNQLGRDIGLMAFGSFLKTQERYTVEYFLSVINGQGINTTDKNESKDVAGRILIHPLNGLTLGSAIYSGYDYLSTISKNIVRQRYGAEGEYSIKRFAVKSEYIAGKDSSINKDGWYAQASWFFISNKFQFILKYDSFDSNKAIDNNTPVWLISGVNYFFSDAAKIYLNYTNKKEAGGSNKQINNDLIAVQVQITF